jgi:hypothetical protein
LTIKSIVLDVPDDITLTDADLKALPQLFADALFEFQRPREDAREYVNKRYPILSLAPGEIQTPYTGQRRDEKVIQVEYRVALAHKLSQIIATGLRAERSFRHVIVTDAEKAAD